SAARQCHHDDEHLREDSNGGRRECHENPGNDVCNYCATHGARKFARDVAVFWKKTSKPRSWMQLGKSGGEGGIRTPGTSFSSYNGLANRRLQPLGHLSVY